MCGVERTKKNVCFAAMGKCFSVFIFKQTKCKIQIHVPQVDPHSLTPDAIWTMLYYYCHYSMNYYLSFCTRIRLNAEAMQLNHLQKIEYFVVTPNVIYSAAADSSWFCVNFSMLCTLHVSGNEKSIDRHQLNVFFVIQSAREMRRVKCQTVINL